MRKRGGGVETLTMPSALKNPLEPLPYATQAPFNSSNKQHASFCLPDTRTDVLTQIREWADGHHQKCIFWLNGMAGTGKSTIALTVARQYHTRNQLGASFFFSRGGGDLSNAGKFFTSVAVQLAHQSPSLMRCICEAIAKNTDIGTRVLSEQWELLVIGPLTKAEADSLQSPLLLVIDALDECEDERDVTFILKLLASASTITAIQLRVLVTSRPETPIRLGFREMAGILHRDLVLHNVPQEIINHDITVYFQQELKDIELSAEIIACLTEKACGLFIWAATACRFIRNGKRVASKRLSLILEGGKSERNPEKELDQIYKKVLSDSISGDYDEDEKEELFDLFRTIVRAIVALSSPLSAGALARLLKKPKLEADVERSSLRSRGS
jgi:NACHT domain